MDYWKARLRFAVQALIEKDLFHEGGMRLTDAAEADDATVRAGCIAEAEAFYERAVQTGEKAIRAMASQMRDDSDRSSVVAYYHFFVREVRERARMLVKTEKSS